MSITEREIEPHIREGIEGSAEEGAELVRVAGDDGPGKVVEAIHAFVSRPPGGEGVDNWTDRALPLGSLWGRQMVRQFGWEWAGVVFHDRGDSKAVGVFSKDRSLAIYPWHFVYGCLENGVPSTILLAFNMLLAGAVPAQEPGAYVNVMDHVRHVVPPG